MTPPSVRFLGRKVYLGAVVILISAMRQGPTPRRVHELSTLFGVDRATVARWQAFWRAYIPQTLFWKLARGRLVPVVEMVRLPLSLLEAFYIECQGTERSFNAPPHLQDSAGVYMKRQVRARLVLRRNCFGVVGPARARSWLPPH
jgi:hypothetical protein